MVTFLLRCAALALLTTTLAALPGPATRIHGGLGPTWQQRRAPAGLWRVATQPIPTARICTVGPTFHGNATQQAAGGTFGPPQQRCNHRFFGPRTCPVSPNQRALIGHTNSTLAPNQASCLSMLRQRRVARIHRPSAKKGGHVAPHTPPPARTPSPFSPRQHTGRPAAQARPPHTTALCECPRRALYVEEKDHIRIIRLLSLIISL